MSRRGRIRLLLCAVILAWGTHAAPQEDVPSVIRIEKHVYDSDYESWTEPYREWPLLAYWYDFEAKTSHTDPALLKVVVVEGDDKPVPQRSAGVYGSPIVLYGGSISVEGRFCEFEHDGFGFKGGGFPLLPEDVVKQLQERAANLPDDQKELPPKGRRLVVQTIYAPTVHVYNRAKLPSQVVELLRLMRIQLHLLPQKDTNREEPASRQ